ncbi:NTPase required for small ribosome subunit synthesis [Wickerhamomyces ciferrii]|uniref:Adenylate kinase isoenzyme 6 homolog n=1 Tax=Wickerhamomyces ciferrii (strain ATCC 14091 / BCRC 22168 / CBS 111 / JCM 3599 / NBRC 0793 / NRRL Y-1031 F-60-10) TaxID=1206466 RepID=K0KEK3_WICCF|nr:NTPase required for small ribosome subunit synthesis [Wickerhamomyces ciferrii]CCH41341.1 NTPase required for small ribosome subunit synthesis [Wickerhamomyces ciferrii]
MSIRPLPNIIITGTPGCGKTSHAEIISNELDGFKHINITDFAKDNDAYDGFDKERNSHIVDEDKLLDALEPILEKGGILIDWHACDMFPERLIDLVVVLRTENGTLYERLEKRNYSQSKIDENLDCEIMEVILQEAKESYAEEIVVELESNNTDDIDSNSQRIKSWIDSWKVNNPEGASNELSM